MPTAAEVPEVSQQDNDLILSSGTLIDLSNRLDKGVQVIKARAEILSVARRAAVHMTSPEDWIKYKDKEGREVAYLQDCGCDRVRDVFGIEVYDVGRLEKIQVNADEFMYVITANGRCHLTNQKLEAVEGGRSSNDDFVTRHQPPLKGYEVELAVRKAARANLDGQICRTLAGLQSVPRDEIVSAWEGTSKKWDQVRAGRGYGSGAERQGASVTSEWEGQKPQCPKCSAPMVYKPSGTTKDGRQYEAFFSCTSYPKCKETVKKSDWEEQIALSKKAPPAESDLPKPLAEIYQKIATDNEQNITEVFTGLVQDLCESLGEEEGAKIYNLALAKFGVKSFSQLKNRSFRQQCAFILYQQLNKQSTEAAS